MTETHETHVCVKGRGKRPAVPPPFPAVAIQLIKQMQNPQVAAAEVAQLIELDPSLTVSLLRLVNSPFFGMRRQIASAAEAVMVLGMVAVRRMVLSLAVATPMRNANVDPNYARTRWQHTVSCAALARHLIDDDTAASEMAFTAGLLHDIGEVHLLQLHGAAYVALHAEHERSDLRSLEIERFGQAHDAFGADLLESWGLPQAIVDAARHHHDAPSASAGVVERAVWLANRAADAPEQAAQWALTFNSALAPLPLAIEQARAEVEALVSLLNG